MPNPKGNKKPTVVLASASPRRQNMLAELGIPFQVHTPTEIEPTPNPGESATRYCQRVAAWKCATVARELRGDFLILGADTVVVLDGQVLGKPRTDVDALNMLTQLCGREHHVISAWCLIDTSTGERSEGFGTTAVRMAHYPSDILQRYVATGEGRDKAGSYAIQGAGSFLVESISGSYSNVVGLPLAEVVQALNAARGIAPWSGE